MLRLDIVALFTICASAMQDNQYQAKRIFCCPNKIQLVSHFKGAFCNICRRRSETLWRCPKSNCQCDPSGEYYIYVICARCAVRETFIEVDLTKEMFGDNTAVIIGRNMVGCRQEIVEKAGKHITLYPAITKSKEFAELVDLEYDWLLDEEIKITRTDDGQLAVELINEQDIVVTPTNRKLMLESLSFREQLKKLEKELKTKLKKSSAIVEVCPKGVVVTPTNGKSVEDFKLELETILGSSAIVEGRFSQLRTIVVYKHDQDGELLVERTLRKKGEQVRLHDSDKIVITERIMSPWSLRDGKKRRIFPEEPALKVTFTFNTED